MISRTMAYSGRPANSGTLLPRSGSRRNPAARASNCSTVSSAAMSSNCSAASSVQMTCGMRDESLTFGAALTHAPLDLGVSQGSARFQAVHPGFNQFNHLLALYFFKRLFDLRKSFRVHDNCGRTTALADNHRAFAKLANHFGSIALEVGNGNLFNHTSLNTHYNVRLNANSAALQKQARQGKRTEIIYGLHADRRTTATREARRRVRARRCEAVL